MLVKSAFILSRLNTTIIICSEFLEEIKIALKFYVSALVSMQVDSFSFSLFSPEISVNLFCRARFLQRPSWYDVQASNMLFVSSFWSRKRQQHTMNVSLLIIIIKVDLKHVLLCRHATRMFNSFTWVIYFIIFNLRDWYQTCLYRPYSLLKDHVALDRSSWS